MAPNLAKRGVERLLIIGALLVFVFSFVEPLTAVAQETDSETGAAPAAEGQPDTSQPDPAAPGGQVADASPSEASPFDAEGSDQAKGAAAEGEGASSSVLGELMSDHGIGADQVATVERVRDLETKTTQHIAALEARLQPIKERLTYFETSSVVLDEQLAEDDLPDVARQSLQRKAALMRARLQMSEGLAAGIREPVRQKQKLLDLLGERAEQLQRELNATAEKAEIQQARLQQAEAAEQAALAEVERARAREARERDEQVRNLIGQRRAVLEETAEVARHQSEQIQQASERRAERVEKFAKHREEIEGKIAAFPRNPSQAQLEPIIDPVFRQVREQQREVRESVSRHEDQVEEATEKLEEGRNELSKAKKAVAEAKSELEELGETVVGEQRVQLAQARQDLVERRIEAYRDIAQARRKQLDLAREQLQYNNEIIERLLPRISAQQRDDFYSIFSDENWRSAWFGVSQALSHGFDIVEMRADQLLTLPDRLGSVSLWGWIFGLFGWLALLAGVVYAGRHYTDPTIRRLTSWALRRRFFQRYPALTIKAAEVLRSIISPIGLYLVLNGLVRYVVAEFPELVFVEWLVDAFFLFWVVMTLVKVIVLPRRYREEAGRSPAPDLVQIGADPTRASMSAVDVISIELTRARKLVRSVRIILGFWLLEHYVPLAVTELLGPSVITKLVETVLWWGLALVVYMVLSTWKDDIAALFERLAKDRLPRSVEFVKNHKDRFYGVLVIGVASIYVLFREAGRLIGTAARDTEWSKRVSNFVFRKRIEMQQKERDNEPAGDDKSATLLPEDYREYFEQRPLDDENFKVRRDDQIDQIINDVVAFKDGRPQGSLAMSAEQGMGKTSMLNDVSRALSEKFPDMVVKHTTLASQFGGDKLTGDVNVRGFVADLFELEEVPETRADLCATLRELEPRVLLLDDCHHFFVREIGGFSGLDTFLEVVNLTDDVHYWVLTFNKYAWNYINRVRPRKHYFGQVLEVRPWSEREIQELIQRRNALAGRNVSFTDLVVTHDEGDHDFYEIIKSANGYFRLLHEFSGGNPMVALRFWKRSIKADGEGAIQVSLFRKPSMSPLQKLSDEYLFALAAIAQHGALDAGELADIINSDRAFCEMALNYFEEREIVELDRSGRRAHISPLYFRQVVKQLSISNFLWD
jgi:chemotaxis protein histidine kinase CheA